MNPIAQHNDWDIVLRDGSTLHLRPYSRADAERVREFLRGLSPETIYFRFFHLLPVERFDVQDLDSSDPLPSSHDARGSWNPRARLWLRTCDRQG